MADVVIQQLRANPTNPSPPLRAAFQKPVTEGCAFKALTKYTGNHSEYLPRLVLQCESSPYKSGREICGTAAVDFGTDRRSPRERCA